MVVKLALALFLALSGIALGVRIQMSGNLGLSYGFGDPGVLGQSGLTFDQQLQFSINGEIENGLYISSYFGTETKWITFYYVPFDLQIGNIISSIYGNNFQFFGLKLPYLSFGKLIGKMTFLNVNVSPIHPFVTLTPMVYGSLSIYLNNHLLNPNLYTVDYTTGTIYFLDLLAPTTFTIVYQSAYENNATYLLSTKTMATYEGYSLSGITSTIFSTPTNQFFASLEGQKNEDMFRTSFNFDGIPSFQFDFRKVLKSLMNFSIRYTSDGFRYPLGISQSPGISGEIIGKDFSLSFGKTSIGISTSSSLIDTSFELSVQNGLSFYLQHKNFTGSVSIFASNVTTYESFRGNTFKIILGQDLSNATNWSMIQISTPVTVEASVNSYGFGLSLSKFFGPSYVNMYISNFQKSFNLGFNSTFPIFNTFVSGSFSACSSPASLTLSGNLTFPLSFGELCITVSNTPLVRLSISNNVLGFDGQCWPEGWSLNTSLSWNIGSVTLGGSLQLENTSGKLGGVISLNVGGTL